MSQQDFEQLRISMADRPFADNPQTTIVSKLFPNIPLDRATETLINRRLWNLDLLSMFQF